MVKIKKFIKENMVILIHQNFIIMLKMLILMFILT